MKAQLTDPTLIKLFARRQIQISRGTPGTSSLDQIIDYCVNNWAVLSNDDIACLTHVDEIWCRIQAARRSHNANLKTEMQTCMQDALYLDIPYTKLINDSRRQYFWL